MKRIYLFAVLLAGGIGSPLTALSSAESTDYGPEDFVYKYVNLANDEVWTDSVCGTKEIEGKFWQVYGVSPQNYYYQELESDDFPPVRVEGDKVMMWQESEYAWPWTPLEPKEVVLYDFSLNKGDSYTGFIYDRFASDAPRRVTATRTVTLFGEEQRVMGVRTLLEGDERPAMVRRNQYGESLGNTDYGLTFVVVENIGAVSLPGYYSWPSVEDTFVCIPPVDGRPWPRFSSVCTRDGKYEYSRVDLGVRAYSQLVSPARTWVYYSETAEAEAAHYMTFGEPEEYDGNMYRPFYASRAIVRDKVTGEVTVMTNPDPAANCVLMRENLGEVYVRGREDESDILLYDYMLQTGQTFPVGEDKALEAVVMHGASDRYPAAIGGDPVKTYSFAGYEEKMGVTEFIGLWGDGAGCLARPAYMEMPESGVAWPWFPAVDCTLACVQDSQSPVVLYTNSEAWDKAEALDALAGVAMTGSEAASVRWYTLQGVPVSTPERGQVYIRVSGSRAEKIAY